MNKFKSSRIILEAEEIADLLKRTRLEKNIDLSEVVKKTKIKPEYLAALEEGKYEKLPIGVYRRNFLKEYAIFLGLDHRKILEIYDEQVEQKDRIKKQNPFSSKIIKKYKFLVIPKIIRNIIIVIIVFGCIVYLGFLVNRIVSPPFLEVYEPKDDITITSNVIEILGQTEVSAQVLINGDLVFIDNDGFFSKEINLKKGLNQVLIKAKKKYSQESEISRQILVK